MNDWIVTDSRKTAETEDKSSRLKRGIKYSLSPYDTPKAVRATEEKNCLKIEYSYIPLKEGKIKFNGLDDGITFIVGENTKRIYEVLIDAVIFNCDEGSPHFQLEIATIENAFHDFIQCQGVRVELPNKYSAAINVFKENAHDLIDCST